MRDKWITIGAGISVGLVMISLLVFTLAQSTRNNQTLDKITRTQQRACIAVNVNRAAQTGVDLLTYNGLKQTISYTTATNAAQYAALAKLGISASVLKAAEGETELQLANEQNRLQVLYWIELTDCSHPAKNVTIHAFTKQTPPTAQYSISNAEQLSPKGF
jgi:hypothetical protein